MRTKKSIVMDLLRRGKTLVFDERHIFYDPCTRKYVVTSLGYKCRYYSHYSYIMPYIYKHWSEMSF